MKYIAYCYLMDGRIFYVAGDGPTPHTENEDSAMLFTNDWLANEAARELHNTYSAFGAQAYVREWKP